MACIVSAGSKHTQLAERGQKKRMTLVCCRTGHLSVRLTGGRVFHEEAMLPKELISSLSGNSCWSRTVRCGKSIRISAGVPDWTLNISLVLLHESHTKSPFR